MSIFLGIPQDEAENLTGINDTEDVYGTTDPTPQMIIDRLKQYLPK